MTKNGNYRMATLPEIDGINKNLGVKSVSVSNNNFKEGDFFYDYSRTNINQIKKIHPPIHFGDASVDLTYKRKGDVSTGMLSYFNNPKYCRPANEMEVSKFVEEMNAELRQRKTFPVGTWMVINFTGEEDTNQIAGYDSDGNVLVHYPWHVKGILYKGVSRINSQDIIRLANDQEIAGKLIFLLKKDPATVTLFKNIK
jgi:hypothetical protein